MCSDLRDLTCQRCSELHTYVIIHEGFVFSCLKIKQKTEWDQKNKASLRRFHEDLPSCNEFQIKVYSTLEFAINVITSKLLRLQPHYMTNTACPLSGGIPCDFVPSHCSSFKQKLRKHCSRLLRHD